MNYFLMTTLDSLIGKEIILIFAGGEKRRVTVKRIDILQHLLYANSQDNYPYSGNLVSVFDADKIVAFDIEENQIPEYNFLSTMKQ